MESEKKQLEKMMRTLRTSNDVETCLRVLEEIDEDEWPEALDQIAQGMESWDFTPAAMVASVRLSLDHGNLEEAYYSTNEIVRRLIMWRDEPWPEEGIDSERWGIENCPPHDMSGIYACVYMAHFKVMSAGEDYLRKRDRAG